MVNMKSVDFQTKFTKLAPNLHKNDTNQNDIPKTLIPNLLAIAFRRKINQYVKNQALYVLYKRICIEISPNIFIGN